MNERQALTPAAVAGRETAAADDAALLTAAGLRQDAAAFEQLYRRYIGPVTAAALVICADEAAAEDIAQQTFATFWERARRLAAKSVQAGPWLLTVARNAAIDQMRAQSPYLPTIAEPAASLGLIADLAPALASLPSPQRLVIELRYFDGLSFRAIADQIGEDVETVKSRAGRAIEQLRRSIV